MRRTWRTGGIAVITAVSLVATATPAKALPVSTGASAYSAPAHTGTAALSVSLSLTGVLGGLLDGLISPIVQSAINPLVASLQGTVNTLVASTLGESSQLTAGTPTQQTGPKPGAFPDDLPSGLPSPCQSSGPQPCYNGVDLGVDLSPLAKLGVGALSGYTQQVDSAADPTNPIFGRARVAGVSVGVLTLAQHLLNPLVSVGAVEAKATCPNDGATAPSAAVSTAGVTLLGGLIRLDVLNGNTLQVTVNGTSYTLASLPVLNVAGVTVAPYGTALRVTIAVSLAELLGGIGINGAALTELLGDAVAGTSLSVNLIVGPGATATATSAKAWGLGVGVDLSGTLNFDLLGLVGARVSVPTGIGGGNLGNLVDLRLAYAACTAAAGSSGHPLPAIPPVLK